MPFQGLGILGLVVILLLAWIFRGGLHGFAVNHLPFLIGLTASSLLFVLLLPVIEKARQRAYRRSWRKRLEEREGLPRSASLTQFLLSLTTPLNQLLSPLFRRGLSEGVLGWWVDAGFGKDPLSLLFTLTMVTGSGAAMGWLLSGRWLLSGFTAFLFLLGLLTLTYSRARMHHRLFQDQFPGVLDRLADSLQAGFSLPQAIAFVVPNLSDPSSAEMRTISEQIKLGFTVDQALQGLYERHPNEDVRLLVEGLTLQRQVGGNMSTMMREMAAVVRKRVELESEVRTMTAQGRLSAVVIALLVPVSLGLLSLFPGYTDVLFKTTIGNLVLITAGILEVIGAAIVARLIRIEV